MYNLVINGDYEYFDTFDGMRSFLFDSCSSEYMRLHHGDSIAGFADALKELATGQVLYFCPTNKAYFSSVKVESLNQTCEWMHQEATKSSMARNSEPQTKYAYKVHRTAKSWVFTPLYNDI